MKAIITKKLADDLIINKFGSKHAIKLVGSIANTGESYNDIDVCLRYINEDDKIALIGDLIGDDWEQIPFENAVNARFKKKVGQYDVTLDLYYEQILTKSLLRKSNDPIGTVHTWANGKKMKKVAEGKWEEVTGGGSKNNKKEETQSSTKDDKLDYNSYDTDVMAYVEENYDILELNSLISQDKKLAQAIQDGIVDQVLDSDYDPFDYIDYEDESLYDEDGLSKKGEKALREAVIDSDDYSDYENQVLQEIQEKMPDVVVHLINNKTPPNFTENTIANARLMKLAAEIAIDAKKTIGHPANKTSVKIETDKKLAPAIKDAIKVFSKPRGSSDLDYRMGVALKKYNLTEEQKNEIYDFAQEVRTRRLSSETPRLQMEPGGKFEVYVPKKGYLNAKGEAEDIDFVEFDTQEEATKAKNKYMEANGMGKFIGWI